MDCVFCQLIEGEDTGFLFEDDKAVAFLDIQPFQRGHTLIVPRRHVTNFVEDPSALADLVPAIQATTKLLTDKLGCDGMNLLSSAGEIAGQEVMHLHVHLVPRYNGAGRGIAGLLAGSRNKRDDDADLDKVYAELTEA